MSTVASSKRVLDNKRGKSPDTGGESDGGEVSGDSPASKRRERKPGRKPLETEAKDKRTAQNRAAQRAFRERRERKMKELEDKVNHLESLNKQSELETKFLRNQISTLLGELKRYNPELPKQRDSALLEHLAKQRKGSAGSQDSPLTDFSAAVNSSSGNPVSGNSNFQFEFPWKMDPTKIPSPSSDSTSPSGNISILDNNKSSISATSSSTNVDNSSSSVSDYSSKAGTKHRSNALNLYQTQSNTTSEFDFNNQFDESVSSFCSKLSMACGTKKNPVPQVPTSAGSVPNGNAYFNSGVLKLKSTKDLDDNTGNNDSQHGRPGLPTDSSSSLLTTHSSLNSIPTSIPADNKFDALQTQSTPTALENTSPWHQPSFGQLGFTTDQLFDLDFDNKNKITDKSNINNANILPSSLNTPRDDQSYWNLNSTQNNVISRNAQGPDVPFIDPSFAFPDYDDPLLDILKHDQENEQDAEEEDPVRALIQEEPSMPLGYGTGLIEDDKKHVSDEKFAQSEKDEVVQDIIPSNDGELLKCSEIWDRITAHPRYSDLDIDGLCMELRTKAKCSEKGVVVNVDDVQTALLKHMQ